MIVQSVGATTLRTSRSPLREQIGSVEKIADDICASHGCRVESNTRVAKLTVRGSGLRSHTGLAYRMFRTLGDSGVNVSVISLSERCIGVVVDEEHGAAGYANLQKEFHEETL